MVHFQHPRDRRDFNIAILCALEIESDAVEAVFDEIWEGQDDFGKAETDQNTYTTGRIGSHNVVLAYMPGMGKVAAASVAASSLHSFPNIVFGLVVGICAAVPKSKQKGEIILGDVIISTGLEQFDFGRKEPTGLRMKDTIDDKLGRSTPRIRSFLKKIRGQRGKIQLVQNTLRYLEELCGKEGFKTHYYRGTEADILYPPQYLHKHRQGTCAICLSEPSAICNEARQLDCAELGCHKAERIKRFRFSETEVNSVIHGAVTNPKSLMSVHFGLIASGDQVIRDACYRDQLAEENGIIAFEMEGAGTWDNFPTIVIKGVCDYADSHKTKIWQPHAAAVAAACTKALLDQWVVSRDKERIHVPTLDPVAKPEVPAEPPPVSESRTEFPPVTGNWSESLLLPTPPSTISSPRQTGTRLPEQRGAQFTKESMIYPFYYLAASVIIVSAILLASIQRAEFTWLRTSVDKRLHPEYTIFAIIGRTGVGKSSFIHVLGGRNESNGAPEICHGSESCTRDVTVFKAKVDNSSIYLMDTPGFDDTQMTERDIVEMIYLKLEDLYCGDKLTITDQNHKQSRAFEQLLGVNRFVSLVFVSNKWHEKPPEGDGHLDSAKENELGSSYRKKMIERRYPVARHDGTATSAKLIVMNLIYKPRTSLIKSHQEVQKELKPSNYESVSAEEEGKHGQNGTMMGTMPKTVPGSQRLFTLMDISWTAKTLFFAGLLCLIAAA
ncbi:MAG: hypothetical protein Q9165_002391 [Trypethelium subeluteriae]